MRNVLLPCVLLLLLLLLVPFSAMPAHADEPFGKTVAFGLGGWMTVKRASSTDPILLQMNDDPACMVELHVEEALHVARAYEIGAEDFTYVWLGFLSVSGVFVFLQHSPVAIDEYVRTTFDNNPACEVRPLHEESKALAEALYKAAAY
jgi:hypothetical protein